MLVDHNFTRIRRKIIHRQLRCYYHYYFTSIAYCTHVQAELGFLVCLCCFVVPESQDMINHRYYYRWILFRDVLSNTTMNTSNFDPSIDRTRKKIINSCPSLIVNPSFTTRLVSTIVVGGSFEFLSSRDL